MRYNNLKPFTSENAKYFGRKGGIASGKSRRRKSELRKRLILNMKIYDYINNLSRTDYEIFIKDFSDEQKNRITLLYRK